MIRPRLMMLGLCLLSAVGAWASTEQIIYNFRNASDGAYPVDYGHLWRDSSGVLYGTAAGGGRCGNGTVFKLAPLGKTWKETTLHSFCNVDGEAPEGDVILDASGNIYGTTQGGYPSCRSSCGTVFKLSKAGKFTVLYSFTGGNDGASPASGVIRDKNGNLYGTTYLGGANNNGVVYRISSSGKFSVIYTFCSSGTCLDGANPLSGLAMDELGHLYGTTYIGGDYGSGVVFELRESKGTWSEVILHSFAGVPTDGAGPEGGTVTLGTRTVGTKKQLLIFGVTAFGGTDYAGIAFELAKVGDGYTYNVIYNFTSEGGDGQAPYGSLLLRNGKLFGTTELGGSSFGTVFELTENQRSWKESVLYDFNSTDGNGPLSGVVADSDNNLYGVAYSGGDGCNGEGCGVVFEITP